MALWNRNNYAINQQWNFLHSVTPLLLVFRHFTLQWMSWHCTLYILVCSFQPHEQMLQQRVDRISDYWFSYWWTTNFIKTLQTWTVSWTHLKMIQQWIAETDQTILNLTALNHQITCSNKNQTHRVIVV